MEEDAKISVSLFLTVPEYHAKDSYGLLQIRDAVKFNDEGKPLFFPGKFPFYWAATSSLPGGHITKSVCDKLQETSNNEDRNKLLIPELEREMGEELDLSDFSSFLNVETNFYKWNKNLVYEMIGEANEVFQGNVPNILGFDLHSRVPDSALNRPDRKHYEFRNPTYLDWICGREHGDFYLSAEMKKKVDFIDNEGVGVIWAPYPLIWSTCMAPIDKLHILNYFTEKIKAGELEINKLKKN